MVCTKALENKQCRQPHATAPCDTDIIFYDDMKDRIAFQQFYSLITAGVTVNGKHTNEYRLEFEEAPKVAFSTNYAPSDLNKSTLGRTLFMLFSDYYHQNDDGADYRESRSVADDFGRPLWTANYPEEDWNADFNFALFCCQFYLSVFESGVKIQPPMQNILLRRHKAAMKNEAFNAGDESLTAGTDDFVPDETNKLPF